MGDFLEELSTVTNRRCSYFQDIIAPVEEVLLWNVRLSPEQTDKYLACGWRHNSWYFYRNSCSNCRRCLPIRLRVDVFTPSKSQLRILKKNDASVFHIFETTEFALRYIRESVEIYNRFLRVRFNREPISLDEYIDAFFVSAVRTLVSAVIIHGTLAGNGFLDLGEKSLSTIYFSFDPHFSSLSPGTFSIMKEIEWARNNGLKYYYLGYYIR